MFVRKGMFSSIGRASALATVVAVTLTAVAPTMSYAGSAAKRGMTAGTSGATDISSRGRRYHGGGGGAAAAAAFAGIAATGIAIAASQSRRDRYYDSYGYYDRGPGYYGGPAYYGGGYSPRSPMYGDGYYGNRFYNGGW